MGIVERVEREKQMKQKKRMNQEKKQNAGRTRYSIARREKNGKKEWIENETGKAVGRVEKQGEKKFRIIFRSKKARILLWKKEREYYLKGEIILDEWLTYGKRREKELW